MARRSVAAVTAVVLGATLLLGACRSSSEQTELADDPADVTVAGNIPTAPPRDSGEDLGAGANELLAELDEVREATDLCEVLSGQAFDGLIGKDFDAAALVTNPAGLTRLLTALDATFAHLVEISPPEMVPTMQTMRDVWTRVASLGPVQDVEARVGEIFAEPQVLAATQTMLTWAPANCGLTGL